MGDEEERRRYRSGFEAALDDLLAALPCDRAAFQARLSRCKEAAGLYADVLLALAGRANPEMAEAYYQESRRHSEAVAGFITVLAAYQKRHDGAV